MKRTLKRYLAVIVLASPLGCFISQDRPDAGLDDAGVKIDAGFNPVDDCPDDVCNEGCADTIDGLCLPTRIDADAPFTLTTKNDTCRPLRAAVGEVGTTAPAYAVVVEEQLTAMVDGLQTELHEHSDLSKRTVAAA